MHSLSLRCLGDSRNTVRWIGRFRPTLPSFQARARLSVSALFPASYTRSSLLHLYTYCSHNMSAPVFKLHAGIQPYAWGKKGSSSLAAQLGETCVPEHTTDEDTTYAEVRPTSSCQVE